MFNTYSIFIVCDFMVQLKNKDTVYVLKIQCKLSIYRNKIFSFFL